MDAKDVIGAIAAFGLGVGALLSGWYLQRTAAQTQRRAAARADQVLFEQLIYCPNCKYAMTIFVLERSGSHGCMTCGCVDLVVMERVKPGMQYWRSRDDELLKKVQANG